MRLLKILIFCLLFISQVNGQKDLFRLQLDSITLAFKTGGEVDSLDLSFTNHVSTIAGGPFSHNESILASDLFVRHPGGINFATPIIKSKLIYSGLPHLGFGYSFGSLGTQFIKAVYHHALTKKLLLNIDYTASKGNGYLRNSKYDRHNVDLALLRNAKKYSFLAHLKFSPQKINQNGGVNSASDTIIENFGLSFAEVNKNIAFTTLREFNGGLQNRFRLYGDSLWSIHIFANEEVGIRNRRYTEESSDLFSIYGVTNYDVDSTADQSQLSYFKNEDGLEFRMNKIQAQFGVTNKYWQYGNLNHPLDTVEVGLMGKMNFIQSSNFSIGLDGDYNLVGAKNEFDFNGKIKYSIRDIKAQLTFAFRDKLPLVYQRSYYSNHFFLQIPELEKQKTTDVNLSIAYSFGLFLDVKAFAQSLNLTNHYFLLDGTWNNDSLPQFNIVNAGLSAGIHIGPVHIYSNSSIVRGWNYSPSFYTAGRLMFKKKIFKDKKLLTFFGVDGSYCDSYLLMDYIPVLDVFTIDGSSSISLARTNLHAFFGFEAGQFRFFGRVENIGYLWNDKTIRVLEAYPLAGMNIRLGITWDFFN